MAKSILLQQFVEPQLEDFSRNIKRMSRPGRLISFGVEHEKSEPADPLIGSDDMKTR